MAYETKLIITYNLHKNKTGFHKIEAMLEMGAICFDNVGKLIDKLRVETKNLNLHGAVEQLGDLENKIFGQDGNYTEGFQKLSMKERAGDLRDRRTLEDKLQKNLPYIYLGSDKQNFTDSYGDFLLVTTIDEIRRAIFLDNAKSIHTGEYPNGYRRFNIALALLDQFSKEKFGEEVNVILFGH